MVDDAVTADWDFEEILIPQILRGCSMMLCMVPINNIALGTLPPDRLKNASGLFNLTRNLGGAVGLAVIDTVLIDRSAFHYARLAEHVEWGSAAAQQKLQNMTLDFRRNFRPRRQQGGDIQTVGHGPAAGVAAVVHGRVHHADRAVCDHGGLFTMVISKPAPPAGGGGGGH